MVETDETLLVRLKRVDAHGAWAEFYQLYWLAIIRYVCKLGLTHAQAQDVLQETMMTLIRLLPQFEYDPARGRFRNFLLTIVHRRALTAMRRMSRESAMPFEASGLCDRLEQEPPSLQNWREAVLEEALCRLRRDLMLDERTLNVFFAYVVDCRSASEVAREFGLKENAIYQIKNRLIRRLQAEVALLMRNST